MKYLHNTATLKLDPALCTGCGRCTEVCPHAVLELKDRVAQITDLDACMECGACMRNCEPGALKVRSGVGCAMALLNAGKNGGAVCCG